jgi:hypothetical protein
MLVGNFLVLIISSWPLISWRGASVYHIGIPCIMPHIYICRLRRPSLDSNISLLEPPSSIDSIRYMLGQRRIYGWRYNIRDISTHTRSSSEDASMTHTCTLLILPRLMQLPLLPSNIIALPLALASPWICCKRCGVSTSALYLPPTMPEYRAELCASAAPNRVYVSHVEA